MSSIDRYLEMFGQNRYWQAAVLVLVALIAAKIVDWIIGRVILRWTRHTETELDDQLIGMVHRPIFTSVFFAGLGLATVRLQLPPEFEVTVLRALKTIVILIWVIFGLRAGTLLLDTLSRLEGRFKLVEPRTVGLLGHVFRALLLGGAVYFLFLSWGIDVGALLASLGIVGIAVGFAAKDTLANLFAGIFILADAPYKIGDFIILDTGERGRVTQIGLRSTRLLTRDDVEVTIPNAVIGNAKIINESGGPWEKERIRVPVGVAYGSDIDHVRQVLLDVALEHPDISEDPEPRVRFRRFGESALELELLGWIDEPVLRGRLVDDLNTAVYKRFAAERIQIPYPKRDVYLHRVEDDGES